MERMKRMKRMMRRVRNRGHTCAAERDIFCGVWGRCLALTTARQSAKPRYEREGGIEIIEATGGIER